MALLRSRRGSPLVPVEVERRFLYTMLLLLLLLPRVVIAGTIDDTAVALCVWSAMALTLTPPRSRIPRAIIHRPVGVRLRRAVSVRLRRALDILLARDAAAPAGCVRKAAICRAP